MILHTIADSFWIFLCQFKGSWLLKQQKNRLQPSESKRGVCLTFEGAHPRARYQKVTKLVPRLSLAVFNLLPLNSLWLESKDLRFQLHTLFSAFRPLGESLGMPEPTQFLNLNLCSTCEEEEKNCTCEHQCLKVTYIF
jgi:hypothetical protein